MLYGQAAVAIKSLLAENNLLTRVEGSAWSLPLT